MTGHRFDPDHHFYNRAGKPITVTEWGALWRSGDLTVQETTVNVPGVTHVVQVRTVYHGFVDLSVVGARLFATVRMDGTATACLVDLHDSEADALIRHIEHVFAIEAGQHCARCKEGQPHAE